MAADTRILLILAWLLPGQAACGAIPVVAAERVYGAVCEEIGGHLVAVTSILRNPAQDPHIFEPSPSAARAIAEAQLVVMNGAGYDPWMDGLIGAGAVPGRRVVRAAALARTQPGQNPHLWYSVPTMRLVVQAVTQDLTLLDPTGTPVFAAASARVLARLGDLDRRVAAMRLRFHGVSVAATEPVFGPMLDALGLTVRDIRFEISIMNGTEPRVSDIAGIEADLRNHQVRALVTNTQVMNAATQRLIGIAGQAGVPVVGVTETLPDGEDYAGWLGAELSALETALAAPPR